MPRLRDGLAPELSALASEWEKSDEFRVLHRAEQVQSMWKDAIEKVYKDLAPYVLSHVNAVYIKEEGGKKTLMVYMDDGNFRADVHSRQHLICLHLQKAYGEEIEDFKTFPARFDMRKRRPFALETPPAAPIEPIPLDAAERAEVERAVAQVDDPRLAKSLKEAMISDLEWKKGESGINW